MNAASWLMVGGLAVTNLIAVALLLIGVREPLAARVAHLRRRAAWCSLVVALGTLAGLSASAWQAYSVLRGDSLVHPADKARGLAEGISNAMNCVAAGLIFAPVPLAATLVLFVRARRLAR
jgi:hypothetical protein